MKGTISPFDDESESYDLSGHTKNQEDDNE